MKDRQPGMNDSRTDTHGCYKRNKSRRRWGPILPVAAALLAGPVRAAHAIVPVCNEVQMTVWGVITPGSTFGLIKNFESIPGVDGASFDLRHAIATVRFQPGANVTDDQLRAAVRSASYTSREIHRVSECAEPVARPAG